MLRNINKIKQAASRRRKLRTRAKISGTAKVPRLNVYKSLNSIYLQLINDDKAVTLASAHSKNVKVKGNKTDIARQTGKALAEQAKTKKITNCVFDRASYTYHGRVKAAAEGAREGGLKF